MSSEWILLSGFFVMVLGSVSLAGFFFLLKAESEQTNEVTAMQARNAAEGHSTKRRRVLRDRAALRAGRNWGSLVWSWLSSLARTVVGVPFTVIVDVLELNFPRGSSTTPIE